MRTMITWKWVLGVAVWAAAVSLEPALANGIAVTNVSLVNTDKAAGTVDIQFDLSWLNSWRAEWMEGGASITNWDAAWVFVKYRQSGGDWQHVRLAVSGHTPATGYTIAVGSSGSGTNVGAFVYRTTNGYGTVFAPATKLRWHYPDNGLDRTNQIDVSVTAIEMVYVPEGMFAAGSGRTESPASFALTTINTSDASVAPTGSGSLGRAAGGYPTGQTAPNAIWPNGYSAFYCMKYEITQGQYTDFLNQLTPRQVINRYASSSMGYRYTIRTNTVGVYTNSAPDRACNFLSWADGCAYADWAGLRPMTELEFEKALRGPKMPVAHEYAWGDTKICATSGGNSNYDQCTVTPQEPCWVYATGNSTRGAAGASYWGIMELSSSVWERPVTIGNPNGKAFTGLHGDGVLDASGYANVSLWPGADGAGYRGGYWDYTTGYARTSDCFHAAIAIADRYIFLGWRGVRAAPSGVGP